MTCKQKEQQKGVAAASSNTYEKLAGPNRQLSERMEALENQQLTEAKWKGRRKYEK